MFFVFLFLHLSALVSQCLSASVSQCLSASVPCINLSQNVRRLYQLNENFLLKNPDGFIRSLVIQRRLQQPAGIRMKRIGKKFFCWSGFHDLSLIHHGNAMA